VIFVDKKQSLFSVDLSKYALGHCISKDAVMGAGIARTFSLKYPDNTAFCRTHKPDVGTALCYQNNEVIIYNLSTKLRARDKPTYTSLGRSLVSLRGQMQSKGQLHLAIPRIGCGLDRLYWGNVQAILYAVFKDTDIEVLVCVHS